MIHFILLISLFEIVLFYMYVQVGHVLILCVLLVRFHLPVFEILLFIRGWPCFDIVCVVREILLI